MFFKLIEGSRTRGHKAALVKELCSLDMRKYSFSQIVINEWNKLQNHCVNASIVNMFKNRVDSVRLSISQWLPCPLTIWNLLFGVAILLNLVKTYTHIHMYSQHLQKSGGDHRSIYDIWSPQH